MFKQRNVFVFLIHLLSIIPVICQDNSFEEKNAIPDRYLVSKNFSTSVNEKPLTFVAQPILADINYDPSLKHISSKNESEADEEMISYRKENQHLKGQIKTTPVTNESDVNHTRDIDFEITQRFYGDIDGSCPNDNTIAVGKNGKIISMMNGEVGIFNTSGSKLYKYNLYSFFNDYIGDPCDPIVQYDPKQDRFIMFVQACGSFKDKVAFGFSASNDPNGNWNIYVFDSDALGNGLWSDYPKMAITRDEVFLGINLFNQDGKFQQSILYQLDKFDGFMGNSITYKIWDGLEFTPMPITSGVTQYYPGAYVVCSKSSTGNSLTIYDITNNLGSSNLELKKYSIPVDAYEIPLSASQYGSVQNLDAGDCRMQSGYYQNSTIHAVHTVSDEGYAAIKYYRINTENYTPQSYTITGKSAKLDYCYPAIAPFTKEAARNESFIGFHATGNQIYPSIRGKVFNHDFTTISSQEIKTREGAITSCYDSEREYNRWGDYMGVAYHYGSSVPRVWVAGSLASSNLGWVTYMAEASVIDISSGTKDLISQKEIIYPNPAQSRINFFIDAVKSHEAKFILIDIEGKLISNLYTGGILSGENLFSFETSSLTNGTYYLQILNNKNEIIKSHKVFVSH